MSTESIDDNLIFYDAECGFCRRMLRIVLDWDRQSDHRLCPNALQDSRAQSELSPMLRELQLQSWHMKRPDGEVLSGGAALPALLELVDRHRFTAKVARAMPRATDRCYRFVSAHRIAFGRLTRRLPDYEPGA